MELYPSMISEKNPTLLSLKTESPLINILTQSGTFSGSPKAKEAKDKPLYQSVPTVESLNGQWKKDSNAMTSCSLEDFPKTTRNKTSIIWTSDSLVACPSNSWKANLQCIYQQLKKALFIVAQKVIPNNTWKFILVIMAQFIKLEPILSSMIYSWPAQQIGAVNCGTGARINL